MDTYLINLDYQRAIEQADALEELASGLKGMAEEDVSKLMKDIKLAWEGDNSEAYLAKVGIFQQNVQKTSAKMSNIAATVRQMAENIRDAELENLRLAQERTYAE